MDSSPAASVRPESLFHVISRRWWLLLLRGVAAVVFGIACLVWPAASLFVLIMLFGAYAVVDGVGAVLWGFSSRWWSMVALGLLSVLAGIATFAWPGLTALILLWVIAGWSIARGVIEIAAAVQLRKEIEGEWMLVVAGLASIAFGVLLLVFPGAGAVSVMWLIGAFALLFGGLMVALSLRLKSMRGVESN